MQSTKQIPTNSDPGARVDGALTSSGPIKRTRLAVPLGLTLALSVFCGLVLVCRRPEPGINEDSFLRIRVGMALPEVEMLLGDVHPSELVDMAFVRTLPHPGVTPKTYAAIWRQGRITIMVKFSRSGGIQSARFTDAKYQDELFITPNNRTDDDRFWRLRRSWRRWFSNA
jgi:hypothetical protein